MDEHSSILEAEQAIYTALNFPVYSNADFECFADFLDQAQARVRSVYMGGMLGDAPKDWRIDGFQYMRIDAALNSARDRLVLRHRASKFFAGQRRAEKREQKAKKNLTSWSTLDGYAQYMRMKQAGFNTRELRIGRTTLYQFASVKDTPKGRI